MPLFNYEREGGIGSIFCRTQGCIALRSYKSTYCNNCQNLRGQHFVSHILDGHTNNIVNGCPGCEEAVDEALKKQTTGSAGGRRKRDEQCPKRGPGLSHTQDTRYRPNGDCMHCGELVEK